MTAKQYQINYSENEVAKVELYDTNTRVEKAKMICSVLTDHLGPTDSLDLLDMSCSNGIMTKCIAENFNTVTGIDIDDGALEYANENNASANIKYIKMDGLHTKFEDESFDIVLCCQMYEHVSDPYQLMSEIRRVLKKGGICYFGATSRLKIIETHYGRIPFLSYLPKPLADRYLRLLGKGESYYETLFTYWGLKKLVSEFEIVDYTVKIISYPDRFNFKRINLPVVKDKYSSKLAQMIYPLLPGYIWLLVK